MSQSCGTGIGNLPQPGDPSTSVSITARGVFGGIQVSWNYPHLNPEAVAHYKLYRNTVNSEDSATLISTLSSDSYFDQEVGTHGVTYYYWVSVVSIHGTVGEWNGPATAQMQPTIAQMLEKLAGEITSSALHLDLSTELAKIPLVEQGLSQEALDRIGGDNALNQALVAAQAQMDDVDTLLQNEVLERVQGDEALLVEVNKALVKSNANAAAISEERVLRVDADNALASQIITVSTTVDEHTATIQELMESEGGDTAHYRLKTDANGHVAGFGLRNEPNIYDDTNTSMFEVLADRFSLVTPANYWRADTFYTAGRLVQKATPALDPNGAVIPSTVVYEAQNGGTSGSSEPNWPTTVGSTVSDGSITWITRPVSKQVPFVVDQGVVYIAEAMIKELNASKIKAGTINAAIEMTAASITGGQLNIANKFKVNQVGEVTILSSTSGSRLEIQGDVIKVFQRINGTDVLRVKLGNLNA